MKFNCIRSKTASAVVTLSCAVIIHAPPAIADSNQEGSIKPTKKAYKTMVAQINSIFSHDGSLKDHERIAVPKIDFLFSTPWGSRPMICSTYEIVIVDAAYCPLRSKMYLILKNINDQDYNDHYTTQAITGTNIFSTHIVARGVAEHATSVLRIGFEDAEHQSLLYDCFSGEALRSIYAPLGDLSKAKKTIANDLSRFMNLGIEKHSGGDPSLTANKRAAFKFGFDPSNTCLNYIPPTGSGFATK